MNENHPDYLTVSIAQMDTRLGELAANEAQTEAYVSEAARRGSDLLLLPELWRSGYDLPNASLYATPLGEGPFAWLTSLASSHGIWIAGALLEAGADGVYNTATLHSPSGELAGVYRKLHLFGPTSEDLYLRAGDSAPVFDLPWGKTALAICYDLRFPELFRHYALQGATLIVIPAQWPRRRAQVWRTLLQARAAENQLFMVGCNRVGRSEGIPFDGFSAAVDPWGNTLVEARDSQLLLTVTLSLSQIAEARQAIPVYQDRRPDVYGNRD